MTNNLPQEIDAISVEGMAPAVKRRNRQSLTVVCYATLKRTSVTNVGSKVVPRDDTKRKPTAQK